MARSTRESKQHDSGDELFSESWSPRIEALLRPDHLSVRVELSGFAAEDIEVELIDEALVIRGERKESHIKRVCGHYSDESNYLLFSRKIALPLGTNTDEAIATFYEGVLQVTMQFSPPTGVRLNANDAAEPVRAHASLPEHARPSFIERSHRPLLVSVH